MPKPRKYELIQCAHFRWRLEPRNGVFYADGRSNKHNAKRHSLRTRDRDEALKLLAELDVQRAAELGLIPSIPASPESRALALAEGRLLYEAHIGRPAVTGGVSDNTKKSYRKVFDKFVPFCVSIGVANWNQVDERVLTRYAQKLETTKHSRADHYHAKTILNELVTLKQTVKWLIEAGHLIGKKKIKLPLRKFESERRYCYKPAEVAAIVEFCRNDSRLRWVGDVVVALYCTGLRIGELSRLRWSAIDLESRQLVLSDETAHASRAGLNRQQLKSRRSRMFPIHPDLFAVLSRLPRPDAFVFHGPRGGRLKPDTVRRRFFEDVIRKLEGRFPSPNGEPGFKSGRFHSFRHFFASQCASNGIPSEILMEWLGHQESEMLRHYFHLHDEESRRRMEGLNFLNETGKRSTGDIQRTANSKSEDQPGRDGSASIAT